MKKIMITACILAMMCPSVSARQYPDSVAEQSRDELCIPMGWNFEFGGGIGVSSYTFSQLGSAFVTPHSENRISFPAGHAGIGLNLYFTPWMGIGTGVGFAAYSNQAAVTKPWTQTAYDTYGTSLASQYTISSTPQNLTESQMIYMVEVPVALKFRARPGKVGFIGTAGVKLGIPVHYSYRLTRGGSMNNEVYYPFFDLLMQDIPGVITDVSVPEATGKGHQSLRTLNYAAHLELGMLVRLSQRVELGISAYATYYFNDVLEQHGNQELGFYTGTQAGVYPLPYTNAYSGVLGTNEVQSLHPWAAGLKLTLQVNTGRTQAERNYDLEQKRRRREAMQAEYDSLYNASMQPAAPAPEPVISEEERRQQALAEIQRIASENNIDLCEALCAIHDTVYIYQTVIQQAQPAGGDDSVAKSLEEELKASVIYFDLDKSVPILEPADILVRIAEVLRRHPEQKVRVNGHACKLGQPDYNKRLALRRAQAVAEQLSALGVHEDQMIVASLGSDVPYRYQGHHQLSKDRRVEIIPVFSASDTEPTYTVSGNVTTETVRPGSRLAQIARRHYGEPEFWVFIYEANQDKIPEPNDLQIGIELIIPDLTERLRGMNETQKMEEAQRLRERILNR